MLKYCEYYNEKISIHALREEGDANELLRLCKF